MRFVCNPAAWQGDYRRGSKDLDWLCQGCECTQSTHRPPRPAPKTAVDVPTAIGENDAATCVAHEMVAHCDAVGPDATLGSHLQAFCAKRSSMLLIDRTVCIITGSQQRRARRTHTHTHTTYAIRFVILAPRFHNIIASSPDRTATRTHTDVANIGSTH